jgi:hypothetical protein
MSTVAIGWLLRSVVGITAGVGGLIATQTFQPYNGFDFVIVMYADVLGGTGSILGVFVQQMSTLILPYQLQNTAIFVVSCLSFSFGRKACSAGLGTACDGPRRWQSGRSRSDRPTNKAGRSLEWIV